MNKALNESKRKTTLFLLLVFLMMLKLLIITPVTILINIDAVIRENGHQSIL